MKAAIVAALLVASSAWAMTANWTGRQESFATVTGRNAIRCEYNCMGRRFWQSFDGGMCPMSIEVE